MKFNGKDYSLDDYLREISHYELQPTEQVQELVRTAQEKGIDCEEAQHLLNATARVVVSVAIRYQNQGATLDELVDAGTEGMRAAIMAFNPDGEEKFIEFAIPYMRQQMQRAISVSTPQMPTASAKK